MDEEKSRERTLAGTFTEDLTLNELIFDLKARKLFPGFNLYPGYEMRDVHEVHFSQHVLNENGTEAGVCFFVRAHYDGLFGNFPKNKIASIGFTVEQHLQPEENQGLDDFLKDVLPLFGNEKKAELRLYFNDFLEKRQSTMVNVFQALGGTCNEYQFPEDIERNIAEAYMRVMDALGVLYKIGIEDGKSFLSIVRNQKNRKYIQAPFEAQINAYRAARDSGLEFKFETSTMLNSSVHVSEDPSDFGMDRVTSVSLAYPLVFRGDAQKKMDFHSLQQIMAQHFKFDPESKVWSIDYVSNKQNKKSIQYRTGIID